jgi:WD40 repeat protein
MRTDVFVVDVVPLSNHILTATSRGLIQLRDSKTGDVLKTAQSKGGGLRDLSVSPNGKRLFLTTRDGAVHVWDIQNLTKIVSLPVTQELDGIAISPDGKRVLVSSGSPVIYIIDSASRGDRIKDRQHD